MARLKVGVEEYTDYGGSGPAFMADRGKTCIQTGTE